MSKYCIVFEKQNSSKKLHCIVLYYIQKNQISSFPTNRFKVIIVLLQWIPKKIICFFKKDFILLYCIVLYCRKKKISYCIVVMVLYWFQENYKQWHCVVFGTILKNRKKQTTQYNIITQYNLVKFKGFFAEIVFCYCIVLCSYIVLYSITYKYLYL